MSATWGWRRRIAPGSEDAWIVRLEAVGCATWTLTERPDRKQVLLAVYDSKRESVITLRDHFGGAVRPVRQSEWLPTKPAPATRISKRLEIVHAATTKKNSPASLHIPHGLAFGSGEHATTFMLLQALAAQSDWSQATVLDLGTGSGVLALTARRFGARKIIATDFDAEAVRTARQNEALNFPTPTIRWLCGDVRKLKANVRYALVLANLFSGILCEAASQISASVLPGGQFWLSGVLHSQRKEVVAAYRAQGLKLHGEKRRGKWIMLQWSAPVTRAERRMPSKRNSRPQPRPRRKAAR